MDEADAVGLELRFREQDVSHVPPDVGAFSRRPASVGSLHARPEDIAVLKGARPHAERSPLVVFFQHAEFGIPPIECLRECPDIGRHPDLRSWSVRPTVFGYLACVPDGPREPRRARAAWVIAACLPLTVPFEAAAAPAEKGAIQRPKTTRPVTAPPVVEAEPIAEPETTPDASSPFAGETPPSSGQEPATEDPNVATPEAPPPPKPSTSGSDPAIVDAAWEGVDGFDVELRLKGGIRMRGRVGAVQRDTFTLIQSGTGAVLVLPKSGVVTLRVRSAPKLPDKNGTGMIAGGVVLTSVATPVFISGIALLAICPSCTSIHVPLLIIGAGMLAGGIPMTVVGARRRQRYRRILDERELAPVVIRSPHGWTGGLRFRF
jgi:hypothetical protein